MKRIENRKKLGTNMDNTLYVNMNKNDIQIAVSAPQAEIVYSKWCSKTDAAAEIIIEMCSRYGVKQIFIQDVYKRQVILCMHQERCKCLKHLEMYVVPKAVSYTHLFMTEAEITELVTKTGLKVLRECGKIVKVDFGNAFIDKETGAFYIFDGQ